MGMDGIMLAYAAPIVLPKGSVDPTNINVPNKESTPKPASSPQKTNSPAGVAESKSNNSAQSLDAAISEMRSKAKTELKSILKGEFREPSNHYDFCKLALEARAKLKSPAERTAFDNKMESIGARFGINFGLSRIIPGQSEKVPLNDKAFKALDAQSEAMKVHARLSSEFNIGKNVALNSQTGKQPGTEKNDPSVPSAEVPNTDSNPSPTTSTTSTNSPSTDKKAAIRTTLESIATNGEISAADIDKADSKLLPEADKTALKKILTEKNVSKLSVDEMTDEIVNLLASNNNNSLSSNNSSPTPSASSNPNPTSTSTPATSEKSETNNAYKIPMGDKKDDQRVTNIDFILNHDKDERGRSDGFISVFEVKSMKFPPSAEKKLIEELGKAENQRMPVSKFNILLLELQGERAPAAKTPQSPTV